MIDVSQLVLQAQQEAAQAKRSVEGVSQWPKTNLTRQWWEAYEQFTLARAEILRSTADELAALDRKWQATRDAILAKERTPTKA